MTMLPFESVPRGCGKRAYNTLNDAQRAAVAIHKRAGQQMPNAYHCKACGSYHFGRDPKKRKEPNMLAMTETKRVAVPPPAVDNRELSWLSQRIAQARKQPFSEIVTITPAIAKRILECNPDNRAIRQPLVDQIAMDITAGRWDFNGEAIIIADTGELNDGQHRLTAAVQAAKPIKSVITFGIPRDSRLTVDIGNARSAGDFLGMQGAKYQNNVAAGARLHNVFRRGLFSVKARSGPTKTEVAADYWANEKAFAKAAYELCNDKFAKRYGGAALIAAHVILHKKNAAQAAFFFSKLLSGADLKQSDPILALRMRMIEKVFPNGSYRLEMILRHWNAWRQDRPMRTYATQTAFPKVEG